MSPCICSGLLRNIRVNEAVFSNSNWRIWQPQMESSSVLWAISQEDNKIVLEYLHACDSSRVLDHGYELPLLMLQNWGCVCAWGDCTFEKNCRSFRTYRYPLPLPLPTFYHKLRTCRTRPTQTWEGEKMHQFQSKSSTVRVQHPHCNCHWQRISHMVGTNCQSAPDSDAISVDIHIPTCGMNQWLMIEYV